MRRSFFTIVLLVLCNIAISQSHGGVEQYYYSGFKRTSTVVPKAYFQNKQNWYTEVRYNYDELETISFNAGKTFSGNNAVSYSITPLAGIMAGKLNGASLGLNVESEFRNIFLSAASQYSFSPNKNDVDYFFNWSEVGYQVTENLFTGVAMQLTHLYNQTNQWEPGIMAGVSINKWTFPLYIFNPAAGNRYIVLGINIEWKNK